MADAPFIGIEIGGTKLQLVAGDASGRISSRVRLAVDRAAGAAGIRRQIEEALAAFRRGNDQPIRGIGAGFGGPVNRENGCVAQSHQVGGWENFPLRDWLASLCPGAAVAVENDSNAAALAEATRGAGIGWATVFYCNFGSGVGGGLVTSGGLLYRGTPPGEMEFGHLRLSRDGGGDTVESRCSGWAVDAKIRSAVGEVRDSALARLVALDPGAEARHLAPALEAGDPLARRVLDEVAGDVGFALSHVVHLLHPDVIVLGGGLSLAGEPLRAAVAAAMAPHVMAAFAPGPLVTLAMLGEDAVPVGALLLAAAEARRQADAGMHEP